MPPRSWTATPPVAAVSGRGATRSPMLRSPPAAGAGLWRRGGASPADSGQPFFWGKALLLGALCCPVPAAGGPAVGVTGPCLSQGPVLGWSQLFRGLWVLSDKRTARGTVWNPLLLADKAGLCLVMPTDRQHQLHKLSEVAVLLILFLWKFLMSALAQESVES